MNKIDRIKEKADYKMDLLKIKNDIAIDKLNLDNKLLNTQNEALEIRYNNTLLKNKTGLFDRLKMSGRVLSLLGILSFLVSTTLSLISGYSIIKNLMFFIGFALIMTVCQIIIFVSSKYNSITKNKFAHRYTGLKAMQISMLLVSLTLNVMFIHECFNSYLLDIIMFPLAFVLDYSTIFFNGIGYDFKNLIFNVNTEKISLLDKLVDNIFYRLKEWIEETYNKNHDIKVIDKDLTNEAKKDLTNKVKTNNLVKINKVKTNKRVKIIGFKQDLTNNLTNEVKTKDLTNDLTKDLTNYLNSKYNSGDMVKTRELKDKFNLNEYGWKNVKKLLPLESKGTKLFYKGV